MAKKRSSAVRVRPGVGAANQSGPQRRVMNKLRRRLQKILRGLETLERRVFAADDTVPRRRPRSTRMTKDGGEPARPRGSSRVKTKAKGRTPKKSLGRGQKRRSGV